MKKFDDEEEAISKKYFERLQGEDRADTKPERISSISPEEYLRREKEEKRKIYEEEEKLQKINRITKAGLFSMTIGALLFGAAFIGIFWIWPFCLTRIASMLINFAILSPFLLLALVALFFTMKGFIKLLGAKGAVEGKKESS
jgi:hypothetical protein